MSEVMELPEPMSKPAAMNLSVQVQLPDETFDGICVVHYT